MVLLAREVWNLAEYWSATQDGADQQKLSLWLASPGVTWVDENPGKVVLTYTGLKDNEFFLNGGLYVSITDAVFQR